MTAQRDDFIKNPCVVHFTWSDFHVNYSKVLMF